MKRNSNVSSSKKNSKIINKSSGTSSKRSSALVAPSVNSPTNKSKKSINLKQPINPPSEKPKSKNTSNTNINNRKKSSLKDSTSTFKSNKNKNNNTQRNSKDNNNNKSNNTQRNSKDNNINNKNNGKLVQLNDIINVEKIDRKESITTKNEKESRSSKIIINKESIRSNQIINESKNVNIQENENKNENLDEKINVNIEKISQFEDIKSNISNNKNLNNINNENINNISKNNENNSKNIINCSKISKKERNENDEIQISNKEEQSIKEGINNNDENNKQINNLEKNNSTISGSKNRMFTLPENVSDKNKYKMKSIINLLNKQYETIRDPKKDANFMKKLKGLNKKDKSVKLLLELGSKMFNYRTNNDIRDKIFNEKINVLYYKLFKNENYEDKNQNFPNRSTFSYSSESRMKLRNYKNIRDYINEKYTNYNQFKKNFKDNNRLYHSLDNNYIVKKANNFDSLSIKNDNSDYNTILNSIDYKQSNIRNSERNSEKNSLLKSFDSHNSDFTKKKLNDYNYKNNYTNYKNSNFSTIKGRSNRMKRILNDLREGLSPINNQRNRLIRLRTMFSRNLLNK